MKNNLVDQIEGIFPATVQVTQGMIDAADLSYPEYCIGALAVKSALGPLMDKVAVFWSNTIGHISIENYSNIILTTGDVKMMQIKEPTTVTISIRGL